MEKYLTKHSFVAAIYFAIILRSIISLHNYSGYKKPPMFGDFEAQRHWQEITVNMPIKEWYKNSTNNDLLYWGLDYPPLTAFHSWAVGKVAEKINPTYVKLNESRGITTQEHKNFMRITVLIADFLIYIPAICLLLKIFKNNSKIPINEIFLQFLLFLCYPGQILIDNGHFQYNNLSLGLTIFAISFLLLDYDILGSLFFSLALNYKQMELYHALPFFIYLLRRCFPPLKGKSFGLFGGWLSKRSIIKLMKISLTVIGCFLILWSPWLTSMEDFKSVLIRLFPFDRGVFEDKVSNFWCAINVIVKIKTKFPNEVMVKICSISTLVSILPSSFNLFLEPSKKKFLYALLNSSLGFFLFSYQVHEKSILIPAISALILLNQNSLISTWFLHLTTFSMFPLLHKDGLTLATIVFSVVYELLYNFYNSTKINKRLLINLRTLSLLGTIILVILYFFGPIPKELPHIYDIMISGYSCAHFLIFFIYFNIKQWKC